MHSVVTEGLVPASTVEQILAPRAAGVVEVAEETTESDGLSTLHFILGKGPYSHYSRVVEVGPGREGEPDTPGGPGFDSGSCPDSGSGSGSCPDSGSGSGSEPRVRVRQTVEYELDTPWWGWLLGPPIRGQLGRLVPPRHRAWWLPPDTLDRRSMRVLCVLAVLAIIVGFQNGLMPETLTYAVKQFHATNFAQSAVISVSRIDVLFALWMMIVADRRGRRIVLLQTVLWGCVFSALGAVAPSLAWLAVSQTVARSAVAASVALIAIYAAEEMPAGSRAYALGILTSVGVVGAGINVFLLVGINTYGWRVIFAVAILGCAFVPACARQLSESRRFHPRPPKVPRATRSRAQRSRRTGDGRTGPAAPPHTPVLRNHMDRVMMILALGFLIQVFALPTTQFLNQFLRTERGYSASHVALYNVFTTVPGGIGVVAGGKLADRYGRKGVAGFSLIVGSGAMVGGYLSHGWQMWACHMVAQIFGGALVPTTSIYGPEIFPTALRGVASGIYTIAQGVGSVAGLLLVGWLSGTSYFGNLGIPIALMATGPVIMAVLLVKFFPETANLELEAINPEDDSWGTGSNGQSGHSGDPPGG